jgi:hypothetical protein
VEIAGIMKDIGRPLKRFSARVSSQDSKTDLMVLKRRLSEEDVEEVIFWVKP